jgi:hypothetical protein
MIQTLKWAWQRVVRGYDDRLFWSFSNYVDDMVVAHVTHLRSDNHGYPHGLTQKKWNKVLDTILKGFRPEPDTFSKGWKKYRKDRQKALVLLAFYWDNLWD